jgi:two-component system, cell cycle sensor histidine kinase and response regulator CckA
MVVDDDQDSLLLFRRTLQEHGYQVLFARGGEAALKVCRMHMGRLDLVITDVIMPGMSGQLLADELNSLRPNVPILFISGIVNATAVQAGEAFLAKPFTPEQLVNKVQELLESPKGLGPAAAPDFWV